MFVASFPILDNAVQGRTDKEVKKNMVALIVDYLSDSELPWLRLGQCFSMSASIFKGEAGANI